MAKTKYIAYGSNLNLRQMARRCPTAKVVGTAMLDGWQLTFRNVATLEPKIGAVTPVAVWEIEEQDEKNLDVYEGYPTLYRKEMLEVTVRGETMQAMVYLMNSGKPQLPTEGYFNTIRQGYCDVGLDVDYLNKAVEDTDNRAER
ncbi:MAG: gamma-glutamylcyclotransferase family protein [Clostridia bacterium]